VQVTVPEVDRVLSTGADGGFETRLPAGRYTLELVQFGYEPTTVPVEVAEGAFTDADTALPLAPRNRITDVIEVNINNLAAVPSIVFGLLGLAVFLNFFGLVDAWHAMKAMVTNTFGVMSEEEKTYVPESEQPRAIRIARIWFAIYAATIALALYTGSILPLMLVGLPRLYGAWHHVMTGLLQHGGLAENVIDHRLNSRTVYMNPVSRFIYWNMNYLSVAADQRPALGGGDGHHQHGGRHQPQARPLSRRDLNRAWQMRREGGPEGGEEKSKTGDPEGRGKEHPEFRAARCKSGQQPRYGGEGDRGE
jgi:hypothetical protein